MSIDDQLLLWLLLPGGWSLRRQTRASILSHQLVDLVEPE
jgi:hypothetical protein